MRSTPRLLLPSNAELAEGLFSTAGYRATICIQQQLWLFSKARCTVKPTGGFGRWVCNVTGAKQHISPHFRFVLCCSYLSSTCWENNFCLKLLTQKYCERTNSSKRSKWCRLNTWYSWRGFICFIKVGERKEVKIVPRCHAWLPPNPFFLLYLRHILKVTLSKIFVRDYN